MMRTKIVYVLVSSEKDIYLEQAWVSIYSLKHFNNDAHVVIVCDNNTHVRILSYPHENFKRLVDETIQMDFDKSVANKERSRWLKTNLRNLVSGDFLFVDTDTVITDDLSAIDECQDDVGIVLDLHCHFNVHPFNASVTNRIKQLFGVRLKATTDYYNSGVIFSKDTERARRFFNRWHQLWTSAKDKKGGVRDQQSLAVTIDEMGIVKPLPGEYNCQVLGSIEYLHTAKIVHFFNTQWTGGIMSPFFDKKFYERLRTEGSISSGMSASILNCRSSFVSPSMIVGLEDMRLWLTPAFRLLRAFYQNWPRSFVVLNKVSRRILKVIN